MTEFCKISKQKSFGTSDYDSTIQQTFSLDCAGAVGDMIYITDTKFDIINNEKRGHGIAEVVVFEAGQSKFRVSIL